MTKEEIYHDYLLICKMKAPIKSRAAIMTLLFKNYLNSWRVTGITEEALKAYKEANFKRENLKVKLERAHLSQRQGTFINMMNKTLSQPNEDLDDWWKYYYENDETIIALKSENQDVAKCKRFVIDNALGLFMRTSMGWKLTKREREYLEKLYYSEIANK